MKFKMFVFACCFSLFSSVFAANQHLHPKADSVEKSPAKTELKYPGYCEIEIINQSYDDVRVSGVFDDGLYMQPFSIYSYESPHYISMYYYGYCHAGMNIYIDTYSGYRIYAGYTSTNSTIRIVPYLAKQAKAEVTTK